MRNYIAEIADIILAIEREMRRSNLWEEESPSLEDLASQQPFCFDTLVVGQWLQWVFIPRMKQVVEMGNLPLRSDIYPYLEECLEEYKLDSDRLLTLVKDFDELIMAYRTEFTQH